MKWRSMLCIMTLTILLAACVTQHKVEIDDVRENRLRMFTYTISEIDKVYLEKPQLIKLAITGLDGLRQIEPDLVVSQKGNDLIVFIGKTEAYRNMVPTTPAQWGSYLAEALEKASTLSHHIAKAEDENIFKLFFTNILDKLDEYSRYASAKKAAANRVQRQGFGGIGVRLERHPEGATIVKLIDDLPAAHSNLRVKDVITMVSGINIAGMSVQKIQNLIRGPLNVPVSLRVRRGTDPSPRRYLLDRIRITTETVFVTHHENVSFLRVDSFNRKTSKRIEESIEQTLRLKDKKLRGIVLDLRNNSGGLLNESVKIANLFLESGKIVSTKGRHRKSIKTFEATAGDILNGLPMVVLINGATASSAEILASALQDNGRAVVVGSSSFGKGTVQTILRLPNNGELILTWALLITPSGYSLQQLGVFPSICTSRGSPASEIVNALDTDKFFSFKKFLRMRRPPNSHASNNLKIIRKMCPWKPKQKVNPDERVATMILDAKTKYFQAIDLARFTSANQLP